MFSVISFKNKKVYLDGKLYSTRSIEDSVGKDEYFNKMLFLIPDILERSRPIDYIKAKFIEDFLAFYSDKMRVEDIYRSFETLLKKEFISRPSNMSITSESLIKKIKVSMIDSFRNNHPIFPHSKNATPMNSEFFFIENSEVLNVNVYEEDSFEPYSNMSIFIRDIDTCMKYDLTLIGNSDASKPLYPPFKKQRNAKEFIITVSFFLHRKNGSKIVKNKKPVLLMTKYYGSLKRTSKVPYYLYKKADTCKFFVRRDLESGNIEVVTLDDLDISSFIDKERIQHRSEYIEDDEDATEEFFFFEQGCVVSIFDFGINISDHLTDFFEKNQDKIIIFSITGPGLDSNPYKLEKVTIFVESVRKKSSKIHMKLDTMEHIEMFTKETSNKFILDTCEEIKVEILPNL